MKLLGTEAPFPSALSSLVQIFHPQNDKLAAGIAAIASKFQVVERRTEGEKMAKGHAPLKGFPRNSYSMTS